MGAHSAARTFQFPHPLRFFVLVPWFGLGCECRVCPECLSTTFGDAPVAGNSGAWSTDEGNMLLILGPCDRSIVIMGLDFSFSTLTALAVGAFLMITLGSLRTT